MSIDLKQLEAMRRLHGLLRKESSLNAISGQTSTIELPFEILFPFTQIHPPTGDRESDHEGCQEGQSPDSTKSSRR